MLGTAIKSKKAECMSGSPTPQPLGLLEQPLIADGRQELQGALQGHISLGRGDADSRAGEPKGTHTVGSGMRVSDMRPYLDSVALLPTQSFANNQQVGQAPSRDSRQELVAETLARRVRDLICYDGTPPLT